MKTQKMFVVLVIVFIFTNSFASEIVKASNPSLSQVDIYFDVSPLLPYQEHFNSRGIDLSNVIYAFRIEEETSYLHRNALARRTGFVIVTGQFIGQSQWRAAIFNDTSFTISSLSMTIEAFSNMTHPFNARNLGSLSSGGSIVETWTVLGGSQLTRITGQLTGMAHTGLFGLGSTPVSTAISDSR